MLAWLEQKIEIVLVLRVPNAFPKCALKVKSLEETSRFSLFHHLKASAENNRESGVDKFVARVKGYPLSVEPSP